MKPRPHFTGTAAAGPTRPRTEPPEAAAGTGSQRPSALEQSIRRQRVSAATYRRVLAAARSAVRTHCLLQYMVLENRARYDVRSCEEPSSVETAARFPCYSKAHGVLSAADLPTMHRANCEEGNGSPERTESCSRTPPGLHGKEVVLLTCHGSPVVCTAASPHHCFSHVLKRRLVAFRPLTLRKYFMGRTTQYFVTSPSKDCVVTSFATDIP